MCRLNGSLLIFALLSAQAMVGENSPFAELPLGPLQEKATAACTSCHEARIIVQQRLSKAAWTKEMDKMIKWGAEVDSKDRDGLIHYFSTSFGPDQATYEAPELPHTRHLRCASKASIEARLYLSDCSTSVIQSGRFRTSRGLGPSAAPTMPSFSIRSIKCAARP